MTMKTRLCTLFAALCLLTVTAFAETAADIRHRMEQRLPQIDAFKAREILGENNRGLLEERKPGSGSVVSDENRDREAVYALMPRRPAPPPIRSPGPAPSRSPRTASLASGCRMSPARGRRNRRLQPPFTLLSPMRLTAVAFSPVARSTTQNSQ